MIVQLLGGIFDGAETDVRGDEKRIAIPITGTRRYATYVPHPRKAYRYQFTGIVHESKLTVVKDRRSNPDKRRK